jgi:hypothetical protein
VPSRTFIQDSETSPLDSAWVLPGSGTDPPEQLEECVSLARPTLDLSAHLGGPDSIPSGLVDPPDLTRCLDWRTVAAAGDIILAAGE